MCPHAQDILFLPLCFGQCPTNEVINAITYFGRIRTYGKSRISRLLQRIVTRIAQIVYRIKQRPIQIKYNTHFSKAICHLAHLRKRDGSLHPFFSVLVGMTRFELATSGPPDRCATGLRHIPSFEVLLTFESGCKSTAFF